MKRVSLICSRPPLKYTRNH